jgi:hypothetical protein
VRVGAIGASCALGHIPGRTAARRRVTPVWRGASMKRRVTQRRRPTCSSSPRIKMRARPRACEQLIAGWLDLGSAFASRCRDGSLFVRAATARLLHGSGDHGKTAAIHPPAPRAGEGRALDRLLLSSRAASRASCSASRPSGPSARCVGRRSTSRGSIGRRSPPAGLRATGTWFGTCSATTRKRRDPNGARAAFSASDDVTGLLLSGPWQGSLRTNELLDHRSESAAKHRRKLGWRRDRTLGH